MHESSYSPPLPLNLSISERAQSFFLKDLRWLVTGFNWSRSTHCWSLHFSPCFYWYRWLFMSFKHSYLLCSYGLIVSAGLHCSYFFGCIYINPINSFFSQSRLFYIVLILRYKTFKDALLQTNPSGFPSKSICFGIFKLFAPVCWWLD